MSVEAVCDKGQWTCWLNPAVESQSMYSDWDHKHGSRPMEFSQFFLLLIPQRLWKKNLDVVEEWQHQLCRSVERRKNPQTGSFLFRTSGAASSWLDLKDGHKAERVAMHLMTEIDKKLRIRNFEEDACQERGSHASVTAYFRMDDRQDLRIPFELCPARHLLGAANFREFLL